MRLRTPNRRGITTFDFQFQNEIYHVSFSRFPNGNIREVFVDLARARIGSQFQYIIRDSGIAISIMLQSGMLISDILPSMSKLEDGSYAGPLGALLEHLNSEW